MRKIYTVTLITVLVMGGAVFVNSFDFFECEDTVVAAWPSPDGRYVATVFTRDCGATTAESTLVNLQRAYTGPFRAGRGKIIVALNGRSLVSCVWKGSAELELDYFAGETPHQEDAWKGIAIRHHTEADRQRRSP